jgi:hypothetical protein
MLKRAALIVLVCAMSVAGGIAWAKPPDGAYLDGGTSKVGVILVHGRFARGNARSPVVNPLRLAIHKQLGYHTLSLNYPEPRITRSAPEGVVNFPAAFQRFTAAITFLAREKGVTQIYIMGHSLGTQLTTAYLSRSPAPGLRGYIGIAIYGGGECQKGTAYSLSSYCNIKTILQKNPHLPVIDVVAGDDETDVGFADERAELVSTHYRQVRIDGADHLFVRKEDEMINAVIEWLAQQQAK